MSNSINSPVKKIVVVGNGMVGHHFVDEMAKYKDYEITVLSAEQDAARSNVLEE